MPSKGTFVRITLALLICALLGFCTFKVFTYRAYRSPAIVQLVHMKEFGLALHAYAASHDGRFPSDRGEIPLQDVPERSRQFKNPGDGTLHDWLYFAGASLNNQPPRIIAASPVSVQSGSGRIVGYSDGSAAIISESQYQRMLPQVGK